MRKTLAEIVVEEGLVEEARVAWAEKYARRSGEPLIVALVEIERTPELALAGALGRHLRLDILDLSRLTVEPEAIREVAHDMARRRRLLPLSLRAEGDGPRTLKVAMADPTDRDGIAEVEISTGCRVEPVLATLSGIEAAIAREYRGVVTAVMKRDEPFGGAEGAGTTAGRRQPFGGDLAVATPALPELGGSLGSSLGTEPYHVLIDEAPLEVRHRALLELLFARGVITPDDYNQEVRRLLREEE